MKAKFGTTSCSYCGREFERVRRYQHLCCRECHDQWFIVERRRALAAWREMQRYQQMIVSEDEGREVA
jgi:DNA-directed RNA polymerase subunit RPC12/RpoP